MIRWRPGELIGKGAFGSVYQGFNDDTGEIFAVKHLVASPAGVGAVLRARELQDMEKEVALLQGLEHPNIVRYLGTQRNAGHLCIFFEYMPGGE